MGPASLHQVITNLPGPTMAHRAPIAAGLQAVFGFDVKHAVSGQQVRQQRRHPVHPALLVRRIEKKYVEARTCRTQKRREFYSIRANNLQTLAGIEQARIGFKNC